MVSNRYKIRWTAYSGSYSGLPFAWNSLSFCLKSFRTSSKTYSSSVDSSIDSVTRIWVYELSFNRLVISCRNSAGLFFVLSCPMAAIMIYLIIRVS